MELELHMKRLAYMVAFIRKGSYPNKEEILRELEQKI